VPELPEVETSRLSLLPLFTGKRILSVTPLRHDLWRGSLRPAAGPFEGGPLLRHGKTLILSFLPGKGGGGSSCPFFLLSRFGMSGRWERLSPDAPRPPHTHLEIEMEDGGRLAWIDPRRFGRLEATPSPDRSLLLSGTGPDALAIDGKILFDRLRRHAVPLRTALMDQSLLSGIGNIYMAEILFDAGLSPFRSSHSLSRAESLRLEISLKTLLTAAIAAGGSTIHSYRKEDGTPGGYQKHHAVYGREGLPCPRCGLPVQRIAANGRSLYFCTFCQPIRTP